MQTTLEFDNDMSENMSPYTSSRPIQSLQIHIIPTRITIVARFNYDANILPDGMVVTGVDYSIDGIPR